MNPNNNNRLDPSGSNEMTDEEFMEWIKNPENQKVLRETMSKVAAGDYGSVPAEVLQAAKVALAKARDAEALEMLNQRFQELARVVQRRDFSPKTLPFLERGMDELTDLLLETGEPYRTRFLKELIPLREEVKRLNRKVKD